ncbi:MAG TPA: hypothetical protein VKA21_02010, partial [Candidatus Binatia bacterium]|nr:hypothetical protein [Candidatus Binatia bacterium]
LAAARWHRRAAAWLGARDRAGTLVHWTAVCDLLDRATGSHDDLALAIEARAQMIFNATMRSNRNEAQVTRLFEEGRALAGRLGTPASAIPLYASYALSRYQAGAVDEAVAACDEAKRLIDDATPAPLRVRLFGPLFSIVVQSGRLTEAPPVCDVVRALVEGRGPEYATELFGFSPLGMIRATEGFQRVQEGRFVEASALLEEALAIATPRRDMEVLVTAHRAQVLIADVLDDGMLALRHAREFTTIAEASPSALLETAAISLTGYALLVNGDPARALAMLDEGLAGTREHRVGLFMEAVVLARKADALRLVGRTDEAVAVAREAVAVGKRQGSVAWTIDALLAFARAERAAGRIPEAALDEADALVRASGAGAYAPFIRLERAAIARDEAARQRELAEAKRLFAAMGATRRTERL